MWRRPRDRETERERERSNNRHGRYFIGCSWTKKCVCIFFLLNHFHFVFIHFQLCFVGFFYCFRGTMYYQFVCERRSDDSYALSLTIAIKRWAFLPQWNKSDRMIYLFVQLKWPQTRRCSFIYIYIIYISRMVEKKCT